MKLFKNSVGRPSNEVKRKRKLFYSLIVVVFICLIGLTVALGFNINNIRGAASNKVIFDIAGVNGRLQFKERFYAKNNRDLTTDKIGTGVVFTSENENTVINYRVRFPKAIYEVGNYSLNGKKHEYIQFVSYDASGKVITKCPMTKVTKEAYSYGFKITKNVRYISAEIYSANEADTGARTRMIQKKIRVANRSNVVIKSASGRLTPNSKGVYNVTNYGNYVNNAYITNYGGVTLYYRWFTYSTLNPSKNAVSYRGPCRAFNKNISLNNLGLSVSASYPERSGRIKIYETKNSCEKDNNSATYLDAGVGAVRYANYSKTATNSKSFVMLSNYQVGKANLNNLSKSIGQQASGVCFDYALAYGVYIMKNGGNYKYPTSYNYPANRAAYGSDVPYSTGGSLKASNYADMFNKVKSNINKGIPLVLWVNNSNAGGSGTHYVTIIGYKNAKVDSSSSFMKNVWVLDPANIGGKVISVPLNKRGYTMKYYDQLRWWSSISKAKMPGIFVK